MTPIRICFLVILAASVLCFRPCAGAADDVRVPPEAGGKRIEVLFLGSENLFNHDPLARFRVIRKALGAKGINFTYSATLDALTPENLAHYDVLLIFANHYTISERQKKAVIGFARGGRGCVLLHCAAGCFRKSGFDEYVDLLGAQFKSHGTGVFRARIVNRDHPVMAGFEGFECWDETYVHKRHGADRIILQKRDDEPWTWVKTYGKGRVFYTASGHDHRCWDLPQYHDLIYRAVRWTAGDEKSGLLQKLELPELRYRPAAVPKDPDDPVGPNNEIQLPLPPAESLTLAQIPPGFALQLFAAEPDVVNPICLNWDERGRLWVVEAFDYPHKVANDTPQDRIKILEDSDGDGAADKVTVFAEHLNICTSVLPMTDGAIATDGTNMVYLRDTDGDGRADRKDIVFSGINLRDTHACVSNLRYGFDNWIYATVGYSGLEAVVGGTTHRSEMGVFRFQADGSALEILQNTSNNTWGLGFTEEGEVVGSTANGNPSWYLSIPNRYFEAAGLKPEKTPRADAREFLYPLTADYFQNSPKEQMSSGAGHAVYTGRRFSKEWWNRRVFICEPPMHLVAAPVLTREGAAFKTRHFERNLYASADAWSAPVAAECGPDGAIWIADWYNPICNHNPYRKHHRRGPGNAFVTDDRDRSHGRIYRIYPQGSKDPKFPQLASAEDGVAALGHPDLFWRLAAQRRLVQNHRREAIEPLYVLVNREVFPASVHALRALEGLGQENDARFQELASRLVGSEKRPLAIAALSVLAPDPSNASLMLTLLEDPENDPQVRLRAALHLTELPADATLGERLADRLLADETVSGHLHTACGLAAMQHPEGFLRRLVENAVDLEQPAVVRVITDILTRLESDKNYLSQGLVALARDSGTPLGKRIAEAAGAQPGPSPLPQLSARGRRGRATYLVCVACHQPGGQGLSGAFPPLAGSPRVLGDAEQLVNLVLKGLQGPLTTQGKEYDGVMPGHETTLTDEEIADVLSYVRNAWSNKAGDVLPGTVKKVRAGVKARDTPWTMKELERHDEDPASP